MTMVVFDAIQAVGIAPIIHVKSDGICVITGRLKKGLVHLRKGSGTP